MTNTIVKNGATFENTWPRYPFAPLVALALMIASRIRVTGKPAKRHDTGPVYQ